MKSFTQASERLSLLDPTASESRQQGQEMDRAHSLLPGSGCLCDPGTFHHPQTWGGVGSSSLMGRKEGGRRRALMSLRSQEASGPGVGLPCFLLVLVLTSAGVSSTSQDFWSGPPSPCRRLAWTCPFVCPHILGLHPSPCLSL